MATERTRPADFTIQASRRAFLHRLGLGAGAVLLAGTQSPPLWAARHATVLAACWDDTQGRHHAGWLTVQGPAARPTVRVQRSVELPTRGHGLALLPDGDLLVVARRPGDWLLRLPAQPTRPVQWHWLEPGRVTSGHVLPGPDGRTVFTTEISSDTDQGLLCLRDARSLEKRAEFETQGHDPHAVSWFPVSSTGAAAHPLAGMLVVANGGIATTPETGRVKQHLVAMDSSLVCLHPQTGELLGQWRVSDPRLSLRHLAWAHTPEGAPLLGVALQAEHDDPTLRTAAPLLAVLDWQKQPSGALRLATGQPPLAGYGGDVAVIGAWVGPGRKAVDSTVPSGEGISHFVVSATRGDVLARYGLDGQFEGSTHWPQAGALTKGAAVWAGGRAGGVVCAPRTAPATDLPTVATFAMGRIDNHWLLA